MHPRLTMAVKVSQPIRALQLGVLMGMVCTLGLILSTKDSGDSSTEERHCVIDCRYTHEQAKVLVLASRTTAKQRCSFAIYYIVSYIPTRTFDTCNVCN